ncbi:hypothetical protein CcaverHIS002_0306800 [Cutaneotrichosporon cavernicola]|uniref:TPR-like protein n=1 Tax=Cutaneotrichosporon cavernicola TaxID=279322 RepID=A0AA48ICX2_9TREE|nr:uncharacterized protein CcaverHIS019_0306720 [Cutaneotrichosporon cavernicola]BEI82812.1 hypothetical protein CcaverHIS002_0306800 [Cutaneotrichosporon cavernicola]BEI90602.1 hypothetical protein CcaverHIS019_0306720 [Cutaneotrichosporon cavernicola]BEI98380.1 hypothetical protein CcaverHIS631_0306790 [Cutaneotrichosporon cavernicola]BEJ06153.1 hypothetical protein CcaverHIS641_0306750 [Cutaneotrichosporon cavernicola]
MSDLPSPHGEPAPFDARLFEPPPWVKERFGNAPPKPASSADSADDHFEDASEGDLGLEEIEGMTQFSTDELKKLLARAVTLKEQGNKHFLAKPRQLSMARDSYSAALDHLPDMPPRPAQVAPELSGIQEVTEEEADAINAENAREKDTVREDVEREIRECTKAVYGNLGAVYVAQEEWKQAVDACTSAIKMDPGYLKAVHRRAVANDKIGSWSSLSSALEDYNTLVTKLPPTSPQLREAKRALATLPGRIAAQQEKEKDEMLGKLKDLGNSLLGKFGLNTDMFKFDEQPGGGYNLRFEQG